MAKAKARVVMRSKAFKTLKPHGGFSYEFGMCKLVSWPCGLWPLEKHSAFNRLRFLLATSSQIFVMSTSLVEIYRKCGNVVNIMDDYVVAMLFFLSFVKFVCLRAHLAKLRENCCSARNDWLSVKEPDLVKIMMDCAKLGKSLSSIHVIVSYGIIVLCFVNPFYMERRDSVNLPFQSVCTFSNVSAIKYAGIYVFESFAYVYIISATIGMDFGIFLVLVMHAQGQLEILRKLFNEVGVSKCPAESVLYVISLSKRYRELSKLLDNIKKTFSEILIITFVIYMFLISSQFATFVTALEDMDYAVVVRSIQVVPMMMSSIFLYCYFGELLRRSFDEMPGALFNSQWYNLPPQLRRNYLIPMMAQTSCTFSLSAGNIFRTNMPTLIKFVKLIASFLSFILLIFNMKNR